MDRRQIRCHLVIAIVFACVFPALALPCGAPEGTGVAENAGDGEVLQVDYILRFETVPAGLDLVIDENTYATPIEFVWQEGDVHMIGAPSPQYEFDEMRYVWHSWSDYGVRFHPIPVKCDETITAYYNTQYLISFDTEPKGLDVEIDGMTYTTPAEIWMDDGSTHELAAITPQEHGATKSRFLKWDDGVDFPVRAIAALEPAAYVALYEPAHSPESVSPDAPIVEGPVPVIGG